MSTTAPLPLGGSKLNMMTSLKDILQAPSSDPRGTCFLDLSGFHVCPQVDKLVYLVDIRFDALGVQPFCVTSIGVRFAKQVPLFVRLSSDSTALTLALTLMFNYTFSFGAGRITPGVDSLSGNLLSPIEIIFIITKTNHPRSSINNHVPP